MEWFPWKQVHVRKVNPSLWLIQTDGDDVIFEGGACSKIQRSDRWRAHMGGVRANATVCRHRRPENSPLESNNQSDWVCGDGSAIQDATCFLIGLFEFYNLPVDTVLSNLSLYTLTYLTGDTVGFAVPRRKGGYVAGVGLSIVNVDWSTRTMTSLLKVDQDKPNNRLNDGKVDPVGRLLAGQSAHLSTWIPPLLSVLL